MPSKCEAEFKPQYHKEKKIFFFKGARLTKYSFFGLVVKGTRKPTEERS
jgi:hypothetical protein